jgi:hypothetical protein
VQARIIPNLDPVSIENNGERLFYQAAAELPADYTVFYSCKYVLPGDEEHPDLIKEADFVIVHPALGYLVVEVKQGEIMYQNGRWWEQRDRDYVPMRKDPLQQAQQAMFAILDAYKSRAGSNVFPLQIRYAVAFPECSKLVGELPLDLNPDSIFLFGDLENLEAKIKKIFNLDKDRANPEAARFLIDKILGPSFKVFARLEEQMDMFNEHARRVLTEEQNRILEETELDNRKIFFGAAGTGKTFIAMEKARLLHHEDRKVFLTCFNRNLSHYCRRQLPAGIDVQNFHDYLLDNVVTSDGKIAVPGDPILLSDFYNDELPALGFDYYSELPEDEKYDAIIVDEGQDFREDWFTCLETMLKEDGSFYVFADPGQKLYQETLDSLKHYPFSKHKLTRNLRNTEVINDWLVQVAGGPETIAFLKGGMPVSVFTWTTMEEERKSIEKEIGRLISQGVKLNRIAILSPNIKDKSCLAGMDHIKEWPLGSVGDRGVIQFSTIRSFKGLEADIVFLVDIREGTPACTGTDVYVGASRGRYLLYVFHHAGMDIRSIKTLGQC